MPPSLTCFWITFYFVGIFTFFVLICPTKCACDVQETFGAHGGEPPCSTPGAVPISQPAPRPPPASLPPLALLPGQQHAWTFSSEPALNTCPPLATVSLQLPSHLGSSVSDLCFLSSLSPNSFFDHLQADFSVTTKKVPLGVPGTFQTTNMVAICQHVSFGTFRPQ